ncbi:MAG: hydrolase [Acidiferrobacter sp.]
MNSTDTTAAFTAPWWARNAHSQTLWPALMRPWPRPLLRRERLNLADGDFIDLDWLNRSATMSGPLLLMLHGLEGSARSPYIRGLLHVCQQRGWRAAVMHFRGCSGEPNRLPHCYHCKDIGVLQNVVDILTPRTAAGIGLVGYSLGGAVLLNWLAAKAPARVHAAAAVSVPFDLHRAADRLNHGFSRFYQWVLLRQTKRSLRRKIRLRGVPRLPPFHHLRTFRDFDNIVTAPLHGFRDADDYYTQASPRANLARITVPTLLLHARDDPFVGTDAVPTLDQLGAYVRLELSAGGGHVGFVYGRYPWAPRYWIEERLATFFAPYLD